MSALGRRALLLLALIVGYACVGCSCALSHVDPDAGIDAGHDTGLDAVGAWDVSSTEVGSDVGSDAGDDAGVANDAGQDDAWRPSCQADRYFGCPGETPLCCTCSAEAWATAFCYGRDILDPAVCPDSGYSSVWACPQDCAPLQFHGCIETGPADAGLGNCRDPSGVPNAARCPADHPVCCNDACVTAPLIGWACSFPDGGYSPAWEPPH